MGWKSFVVLAIFGVAVAAEDKLRMCATDSQISTSCNSIERNSPLKCQRALDSASCAVKLAEGKADFGIFTADELLLAHHFYPTGIQVVAQLRNKEQINDPYEFQSVVIVPKSYVSSEGNFGQLVGSGLCHPGFSKSQKWNNHVMKYFEQKVLNTVCRDKMTVAENEIVNLKDFFKKGCRPGEWVSEDNFDKELKKKYPELCELCDRPDTCKYSRVDGHGHMGALDCLTSGQGKVAYVSLHYVKQYFAPQQASKKMSDYQFLCENGTVVPLHSTNPCTWFKQPWKVILAREATVSSVLSTLTLAHRADSVQTWMQNLNGMLFMDDSPIFFENYTSPAHYLSQGRDVELPKSECGNKIRWCTVNQVETNKCNWTSAAALTLGIKPAIECIEVRSTFECFQKISNNEADIITIDSNYGHLARKVYGLSPILFCDTQEERNSFVVAAIREKAQMRRITSLSEIKNSNACFPEYGGIAWLSFINTARSHKILSDSCDYPKIVSNLLQGACTPGFVEANHYIKNKLPRLADDGPKKLCDLCPTQNNGERCEASSENAYFGDKGALDCLRQGVGDIAFLEARNINNYINNGSINATDFRVLCRNGSLAEYTGFNVDKACALSVTIDSEVVSRRNSGPQLQDTTLALLQIEDWLGYRGSPDRRAIHVYNPFNDTENVLFKDSTLGLLPTDSDVEPVHAYKELFEHVNECTGGAMSTVATALILIVNLMIVKFI